MELDALALSFQHLTLDAVKTVSKFSKPYMMLEAKYLYGANNRVHIKQITIFTGPCSVFLYPVSFVISVRGRPNQIKNDPIEKETGLFWNRPGLKLKVVANFIRAILDQEQIKHVLVQKDTDLAVLSLWLKHKIPHHIKIVPAHVFFAKNVGHTDN